MSRTILLGAQIVNEGKVFPGTVIINGEKIAHVLPGVCTEQDLHEHTPQDTVQDCRGLLLLPGAIDDQVHFREPGLTHKATIASESRAAVAGGVTSFMDMPNTNPTTTTPQALQDKLQRGADTAWANYSFFYGGTNSNFASLADVPRDLVPGIKLFLGASTGNMLVDSNSALHQFFSQREFLVAIHSESEPVIRRNKEFFTSLFAPEELDARFHPLIRSHEACYRCTQEAMEHALKLGTRLHILHLSTAWETQLLPGGNTPIEEKQITAEVCVHHLWFASPDYKQLGNRIKWNPAVKTPQDREALREALASGRIDIIATDHAPHLLKEKEGNCLTAASGGPLIQYSLLALLELSLSDPRFTLPLIVEKTAHNPARLFGIQERGFIRPGYYADLVLIDPNTPHLASDADAVSLCAWTPFDGHTFPHSVHTTWVNGSVAYHKGSFPHRPPVHALRYQSTR